jgi:hypothetical protein
MTMLEDWECTTCHGKSAIHLCNSTSALEKALGKKDCSFCGAKDVNIRHLCKGKIATLTHMCANCGSVSDKPELLCNAVPIDESQKVKGKEIPDRGSDVLTCKNCEQPIAKPGHICDPILPYECKYCNETVSKSHHMCKGIKDNAKYLCKICGRLAVEKSDVCAGWELDK